MALSREQIEHLEYWWKESGNMEKPWRHVSHSRRWLKKQVNKYIRLKGKKITEDEQGGKVGRKPFCGFEY